MKIIEKTKTGFDVKYVDDNYILKSMIKIQEIYKL